MMNRSPLLGEAFVAPRTPTEEMLASIWGETLGCKQVGIHDNFFELGGHSLLAMRLVSRISSACRAEVNIRTLFEMPTVAGLASLIHQQRMEALPSQEADSIAEEIAALSARAQPGPSLSFAQERLWFLDKFQPGSVVYSIPHGLRLTGELEVPVLLRSLSEIVRRHQALRTRFKEVGGQSYPVVEPMAALEMPFVDLSSLPEERREAETVRLCRQEAQVPFDLRQDLLLRAKLFRLAAADHVLFFNLHHIASDGWSMGLLVCELRTLYQAFIEGRPSPLEELPIQYADYAVRQREWLQGEVLDKQLSYWKKQLEGAPALLELPADRARPAIQSYRGALLLYDLPQSLSSGLAELSRGEGVSLFMTLLAAFQTLLQRYTARDDIVVGSAIAGRNRKEIEPLIGLFVNTLVLRGDLSGNPSFRTLLGRTRDMALEAYVHQDLPFERLLEALHPERDLSHSQLFQVMFILDNIPPETAWSGLEDSPILIDNGTSKFDLTLFVRERAGALQAVIEYNTDLFEAGTIRRMLGHYRTLLEGIVSNPERRLADLPLLTPAERQQLLVDWNRTEVAYPRDRCLHELIEDQVQRTPEAVAVVFGETQLTYRQLNQRANSLAHDLQELGVGPDTLVGICVERSLEMVIGLLGILKAGGAYVPLDPEDPTERLAFMLGDAGVRVLVTQASIEASLPSHQARIVRLDRDWCTIAQSPDRLSRTVTAQHLAYMIYTSGSTGAPKGAMNTHLGIVNRLLWMQDTYRLQPSDRVLQKTPFSFDVSIWEIFWPLLTGAGLVVARPGGHRDSAYLSGLIPKEKITTVHFVPSMLSSFLEHSGLRSPFLSLKRVICSGEALSFELQQRFFSCQQAELHNLYGPTEAAVDVTHWACERNGELRIVPLGRPIANTQIYILDRHLMPVPVGVAGELHIGGVPLARGYHHRAELTAERFIADPFSSELGARLYKTGDLARYLPDGNLEFLGRLDHQVKIRGFRIELGEIESLLAGHPGVAEAVGVVREDVPGDKRLVAYVTGRGEQPPALSELRALLQTKLPVYMIPSAVVTLDRFPLTPNGKVDRMALPKPDLTRIELGEAFVAPRTPAQERLAGIWCEILGLKQVGIHDNFFDLGGHSLLAIRLISEINRTLNFDLPVLALFQYPTIGELEKALPAEHRKGRRPELTSLRSGNSCLELCFLINDGNRGLLNLARLMGGDCALSASIVTLAEPVLRAMLDKRVGALPSVEELAAEHVALIGSRPTDRPLVLAGRCFGGLLAFEVAHQLQRNGKQVEAVLMLDTWMREPEFWWQEKTWWRVHLRRLFEQGPPYLFRKARKRVVRALDQWTAKFKLVLDVGFGVPMPMEIIEHAVARYRPKVLASRGVLLLSRDDWRAKAFRQLDATLGASQWFGGGVEVLEVPGDHQTILDEPHLPELAQRCQQVMELLQSTRASLSG